MKTERKATQQRRTSATTRKSTAVAVAAAAPDWNAMVARAITEDQNRNYETALLLYRSCIGMMLDELEPADNEEGKKKKTRKIEKAKRKQLKLTIQQLLRRAEELQEYLSSSKVVSERVKTSNDLCVRVPTTNPSSMNDDEEGMSDCDNNNNNNHSNCCGNTSSAEAHREKEWAFKFDLRFNMRSRIVTPSPTTSSSSAEGEDGGSAGGGLLSPIVNIVKMMGHK